MSLQHELEAAIKRRSTHNRAELKDSPYAENGKWTDDSERLHDIDAYRIADAYLELMDRIRITAEDG